MKYDIKPYNIGTDIANSADIFFLYHRYDTAKIVDFQYYKPSIDKTILIFISLAWLKVNSGVGHTDCV